eukprot:CAMPEP_0117449814 /NCGR_PEP_ID=MMETSP0759-20121206/8138_1 /TAXON_ID=63605 /ORGANISM="Percolomonas cosmopolitus, Strain WS" /LENGTH=1044 /DNA_ID=CAMNT_0005242299 /DNA_START=115 /DNA_END=3249 /DNA_ORIENTATION=+
MTVSKSSLTSTHPPIPSEIHLGEACCYKGNHFNESETKSLLANYLTCANFSQKVLTLKPLVSYSLDKSDLFLLRNMNIDPEESSFRSMFPYFKKRPELEKLFFDAFMPENTPYITFKRYVRFMSIVARGTQRERLGLTLKILDRNHENRIQRDEFIKFVERMVTCLSDMGYEITPIEPRVVADMIFCNHHKQTSDEDGKHFEFASKMKEMNGLFHEGNHVNSALREEEHLRLVKEKHEELEMLIDEHGAHLPHRVDSLSYEAFMRHSKKSSSFSRCFGLFSVIYRAHLKVVLKDFAEFNSPQSGSIERFSWSLGTPGTVTPSAFSYSPFSSPPPQTDSKDPLENVLPSFEGHLTTKKWDSRKNLELRVQIRNGFMIVFDEKSKVSAPWRILVLHDACAQPVNHAPQAEKQFLLTVKSHHGKMSRIFEAESREKRDEWISVIGSSAEANLPVPNRYDSFAPVHCESGARFFTFGSEYFSDLAINLKAAKKNILITAWHFTPDIYLTRTNEGYSDRLDEVLLKCAENGVKIYLLIWKNIPVFPLASHRSENELKHENIFVIRDPRHMSNIWTHHQKMVVIDGAVGYVGGMDLALGRFDTREFNILDEDEVFFPGLDYHNQMAGYTNYDKPINEKIERNRSQVPRLAWHDAHCKVHGAPVLDLQRNFIQRWEVSRPHNDQGVSWIIIPDAVPQKPAESLPQDIKHNKCSVQIVRSASSWSFGFNHTEHSMYNAQINAIRNSKHFIFIENQFFTSTADPKRTNPRNLIVKELLDRVERAHKMNEDFRIIVVHPQQTCSPLTNLSGVPQRLLYWQYATLWHAEWGFWKALKKLVGGRQNALKYFSVSSLQNHGRTKEGLCLTEIVYVHAKIMIVDDDIAFISSHNLNDRSFLGNRDSEIGVIVQDQDMTKVPFGGIIRQCGNFAHDLRMEIFRNHLGLNPDKSEDDLIRDPIAAFDFWNKRAAENMKVYLEVFKYIHASIEDLKDLHLIANYNTEEKLWKVCSDWEHQRLQEIKGFVIEFPRSFLQKSWKHLHSNLLLDSLPFYDSFYV